MAQSLEEELQQFAEHDIPLAEFHSFTRKTERLDEEEDRSYFRQLQELEEKYSSADVYTPKTRGGLLKNRYSNIKPSEAHRVKLSEDPNVPDSDYINACLYEYRYAPGVPEWVMDDGEHQPTLTLSYIMAQAPPVNAIDDFWRMIWERNVRVVMMITRLVESDVPKADQYWPRDRTAKPYGDITVTLKTLEPNPGGLIRTFELERGGETRTLEHCHYTAWKDHNVPRDFISIVKLFAIYREARDRVNKETNGTSPVLFHCSAGVGRTGTFVTIDTILEQIRRDTEAGQEVKVNIFRRVAHIRKARPGAIQTASQYGFIFKFVDYCLEKNYLGVSAKPAASAEAAE